jgi:hypothetical protein
MNAVAATMRRMPSEIRARFRAEAQRRRLLRARFRAEAEERKLDELLDRISDDGETPDQGTAMQKAREKIEDRCRLGSTRCSEF